METKHIPSTIVWWYDRGTSARHVKKFGKRTTAKGVEEVVVLHTYGRDTWRQDRWGDWKIYHTTDEHFNAHGPIEYR